MADPPARGAAAPFSPTENASPNDVYAALIAAAGYVPVTLTGEDYVELLPAQWRAIGDAGVQIDYRTYNSSELRGFAGESSGIVTKGGRWEVHYDPYDVSRVWVRNHPPRLDHRPVDAPEHRAAAVRRFHLARSTETGSAARRRRRQRDGGRGDPGRAAAPRRSRPRHPPSAGSPCVHPRDAQPPARGGHRGRPMAHRPARTGPAPALPPALPVQAESDPTIEADAETVVPFGLLDAFDEQEGRW
ncbi:Mu transposase C-terminal domain-containing protein [Rhodococcus ruber]|nr:Mu transposase C-terminal domain-containing protein [Rhodococcus ruber]